MCISVLVVELKKGGKVCCNRGYTIYFWTRRSKKCDNFSASFSLFSGCTLTHIFSLNKDAFVLKVWENNILNIYTVELAFIAFAYLFSLKRNENQKIERIIWFISLIHYDLGFRSQMTSYLAQEAALRA